MGALLYVGFIEMHHDSDEHANETVQPKNHNDVSLNETQKLIGKESAI